MHVHKAGKAHLRNGGRSGLLALALALEQTIQEGFSAC